MNQESIQKLIIDELGIQPLSPEAQARVVTKIAENCMKQLVLDIYDAIPENEHDEFKKLLDSQNFDALFAFIEKHIADPNKFVARSVAYTVKEFKKLAGIA